MKLKAPDDDAATIFSPINCFSAICVAAFLTIVYPSTGIAQRSARELNATEQWVVTQTSAGEIADLSKQFPDKEKDKRKLSAHFLEELLTGALPGIKPHRHGVRIIGAIIEQPVDLENAQIPSEVWLEHCQFNASANFNGANFAGTISFENSMAPMSIPRCLTVRRIPPVIRYCFTARKWDSTTNLLMRMRWPCSSAAPIRIVPGLTERRLERC